MAWNPSSENRVEPVGVIGAGAFGTALANILARNGPVLLYARRAEVVSQMLATRQHKGQVLHKRVMPTHDLLRIPQECTLMFPVIPSQNFPGMLEQLGPLLKPWHIVIHGTKGLYVSLPAGASVASIPTLDRSQVHTMSELIRAQSLVLRIGCVAGPNLAAEIARGDPTAAVVASRFDEVIEVGCDALRNPWFRVHGSHDLEGIELAGVLKNVIAIASGIIHGLGFGDNTLGLLVTHGLAEMAHIGKALGADPRAFLGLAGVGDLVATASSRNSRNFTVGYRLAGGESLSEIMADMEETAEGVNTVPIVRALAQRYKIPTPLTLALYRVLYEGMDIQQAIHRLMDLPFTEDVDFI